MWSNIGRTFAEYMFLKNFRYKTNNKIKVKINGINYLEEIKKNNEPVIFFSGHFANFELMPMNLDKSGVKTVAIYRPLNNFFLDPILQYWRMKYVCPNYIQKGRMGIREIISRINNGYSIALMVDQRISEGPRTLFFNKPAHTTTIPAQIALKYNCRLVPISLERKKGLDFEMNIHEPYKIQKTGENEKDLKDITLKINSEIEKMILKNPTQWMWPHNRWK